MPKGQVLAQQPVGVLAGTPLPRAVRVAEVDMDPGVDPQMGVLVERTTRLVLLAKMEDATAESALKAFSAKLTAIAAPLRQTLTYDQGREMASHQTLTERTGVKVYFCDPHSPWQRGTCENTNGLLRTEVRQLAAKKAGFEELES